MNFPVKPVSQELEDIASLGFDYVELTMDPPQAHYTTIRQNMDSILSFLKTHSMNVICHLPTFVSTADLTDSIREASLQEMFNSLEVAAELGSLKVVLHPGHIGGLAVFVRETVMAYANDSLAAIIGRAEQLGLCVCLENMFPKCRAFFEPADFVEILQRFPKLKLTLDTGHANIGARGSRRTLDFIKQFGPRIGHIHVSDNFGERDDHIPVGSGTIDFSTITKTLKTCGYDDTTTLEIFSEDRRQLQKSRDLFDQILKTANRDQSQMSEDSGQRTENIAQII
jgi:sugar phosphate isomerase/epimerase